MKQRARNFIGAVALVFSIVPFGARADEKPIGILLAVGDIATCPNKDDEDKDIRNGKATAELIKKEIDDAGVRYPGVELRILGLGDLAYNCGATKAFKCFDETWGGFKNLLLPVPGNHEYEAKRGEPPNEKCVKDGKPGESHAKPYFKYFEATLQGLKADKDEAFYSLEFPTADNSSDTSWLLIGLNSSVSTGAGGDQVKWLISELERTKAKRCVLAFAHAYFYSSGAHGHNDGPLSASLVPLKVMHPIFETLYNHRVSAFVAGHDHHYEQLGRANAAAKAGDRGKTAIVPDGVRSFVVGTGGKPLYSDEYKKKWAFTEAFDLNSFGILKILLYPGSYTWEFIPTRPNAASMTVIRDVKTDKCNRS